VNRLLLIRHHLWFLAKRRARSLFQFMLVAVALSWRASLLISMRRTPLAGPLSSLLQSELRTVWASWQRSGSGRETGAHWLAGRAPMGACCASSNWRLLILLELPFFLHPPSVLLYGQSSSNFLSLFLFTFSPLISAYS